MYCPHCGKPIQTGQLYCPECGKPLASMPAASVPPAMVGSTIPAPKPSPPQAQSHPRDLAWHVRLLGIFWIIYGGLRIIPGLFFMSLAHVGRAFLPWPMRGFLAHMLVPLGVLFAATAVAGIVVGWGLLQREPWARILALVLGALALVHIPIGTALGIYTFWALLSAQSGQEYRALSRPA